MNWPEGTLLRATDGRQVVVAPYHRDCMDGGVHTHLLLNGRDFAAPSSWTVTEEQRSTVKESQ